MNRKILIELSPFMFRILIFTGLLSIFLFLYWLGGGNLGTRSKSLSITVFSGITIAIPIVIASIQMWSNKDVKNTTGKFCDLFGECKGNKNDT